MWNHSKSLLLTAWWIRIALAVWLMIALILPFAGWKSAVLAMFYLLFIPILLALYGLHKMLHNIQNGIIFAAENTSALRLTSWACFFAAVFLLAGACLRPVLIAAAGVIGFLGLFARVIKNMLTEAIRIKEENDFTI